MNFIKSIFFAFLIFASFSVQAQSVKYKCMIQMTNYTGEGAYIAISLMNKNGTYNKTLYVLGPDKKWHPDWKEWNKAFKTKKPNLSGITGASISGGDRTVVTLNLDKLISVSTIFSLPPRYSTNLLKSSPASFLLAFRIANKIIIKIIAITAYSIFITILII